ncbi:MAG: biotin--[acetyl-CoA-carboxylase] ligase [Pseudomonadota bacterium]
MTTLDADTLRQGIEARSGRGCLVDVFAELPSTNAWLMSRADTLDVPHLCVAETQTAGRGRRGRQWLSPQSGVTFSIGYRFACNPSELGGLSLVVACAVVSALESLGASGLSLKWPNDIQFEGRKLCGILIETTSAKGASTPTVTGVGLNYIGETRDDVIDQPFVELCEVVPTLPERQDVISAITAEVLTEYARFEQKGIAPCLSRWRLYDALAGRDVRIDRVGSDPVCGRALGLNASGELQIETSAGVQVFQSGEVSVRLSA